MNDISDSKTDLSILIENNTFTANDNNKRSNTTTINQIEGNGNKNGDIDASKPSQLCTNESSDKKGIKDTSITPAICMDHTPNSKDLVNEFPSHESEEKIDVDKDNNIGNSSVGSSDKDPYYHL